MTDDKRRLEQTARNINGIGFESAIPGPYEPHDHTPRTEAQELAYARNFIKLWEDRVGGQKSIKARKQKETVTMGKNFATNMWDVLDQAGNLLLRKHNDYGPLNISQSPGGPLNGLRVRMWDKLARINNLIDNSKNPENESLRDSFIDLANYSLIALMVLDGTWPELPKE